MRMHLRKLLMTATTAAALLLVGNAAAAPSATTAPAGIEPRRLAYYPDLMPRPAVFPDGTLAAFFLPYEGPTLPGTPAKQSVSARYSSDNGTTWSETKELFQLPSDAGAFGYHVLFVDKDGEVHLFLLCDANTGAIRPRPASEVAPGHPAVEPLHQQRMDIWHVRSYDGRTRWSEPKMILKTRAGDLQSVTQLRDGRIILPICWLVERSWSNRGEGSAAWTFNGQFDSGALYSDDGGATWTKSRAALHVPTANMSDYGGLEPVIIQLKDGRVWMLIRTQLGRFYESFSSDRGETWSSPRPTDILASDSPPALTRTLDGKLVMIWNNCQRYPYANGARNVLHAAISEDEGKTWSGAREIIRDPLRNEPPPPAGDHGVSYVYPALMRDGRIAYSMWVESGPGRSLESFDPKWLQERRQSDDFADGLSHWSTFGTRDAELTKRDDVPSGTALSLRISDTDWPPATAVWNFPSSSQATMRLRARFEKESAGVVLRITDHFSVPFDLNDAYASLFEVRLDESVVKSFAGRWVDVVLFWNTSDGLCHVSVDGKDLPTVRQQKKASAAGPCYLRIRPLAIQPEAVAFLLNRIEVERTGK